MSVALLLSIHKQLNAHIQKTPDGGNILDYGNAVEEHKNVRENVGIIDLSFIGKIKVTGKDNATYLHNRLSNSIETLKTGQGCYATLLDYKGRMISDLWVHRLADLILVTTNAHTCKELYDNFQKFIFSEDVQFEDITDSWGIISVQGPNSKLLINKVFNSQLDEMQIRDIREMEFQNINGFITKTEWTGEEGYHLIYPNNILSSLWSELINQGKELNVRPFGLTAFDSLRLEAGIPIFNRDMNNENIPLESGLKERAISYTKGCYPGQEIIARITNLGHPRQMLVGLEIQSEKPVSAKSTINVDEQEIGKITSCLYSPTFSKVLALGYVQWGKHEPGGKVEIKTGDSKINAQIVSLPFYTRS